MHETIVERLREMDRRMRLWYAILLLNIVGCCSSDHIKEGDALIFSNAKNISSLWSYIETLPVDKPDAAPFLRHAEKVESLASDHVARPVEDPVLGDIGGIAHSAISGDYITAGIGMISLVGGALFHRNKKKQYADIVDQLEKEPDVKLCRAIRSGVV